MGKPAFALVYLFLTFSVHGQDYNLTDGIALNNENKRAGTVISFKKETDVRSIWDNGTVVRYSHDENNSTNLGKFVEIEYDMGFNLGESFISQGKMRIIFSNLTEIAVTEESIISRGTLIGKTKKVQIFIVSDTDTLEFLKMWTNNRKTKIGDYWYWDPSFLKP